jgi:hypothetical protein
MEEEPDSDVWKSKYDLCAYEYAINVSTIPIHDEVVILSKDTLKKHTYYMNQYINEEIVVLTSKKKKRIYKYIDKYYFYHRKPVMDKEHCSNYLKKLVNTDFEEIFQKINKHPL